MIVSLFQDVFRISALIFFVGGFQEQEEIMMDRRGKGFFVE
jgi:hypothetical protein